MWGVLEIFVVFVFGILEELFCGIVFDGLGLVDWELFLMFLGCRIGDLEGWELVFFIVFWFFFKMFLN